MFLTPKGRALRPALVPLAEAVNEVALARVREDKQRESGDGFDGTWVMCKDPHSDKVTPIYSEPQLVCAPWKLTDEKFVRPSATASAPPESRTRMRQ